MKPGKPRKRRLLVALLVVASLIVISIVTAVVVSIRIDTGQWRVPEKQDFVRIAHRLDHKPSKVIYLERHAIELKPGEDDAAAGYSSVLASAGVKTPMKAKGWGGGDARWKSLVGCVTKMFKPFDVVVTDQRPTDGNFIMVVVGGTPLDVGITDAHHVSGLAPFNGSVIPRAIVFGFSATSNNDVRQTCETIAMEVAHAYGLDHEYLCKDVMTYLSGCGNKSFVDADVPCGEAKKRACEGGAVTQNSYRRLVEVLGTHPPVEQVLGTHAPGK
ncbi:MAG TPA: hypothetical protein VLB44_08670 [Kofleriaceae bacterium]|nr:hypothetical protein [Kofleriaceae bacterium]